MRIGIVSDTHMIGQRKVMPQSMLNDFAACTAILHAGDWLEMSVYETLAAIAPVEGVAGNGDEPAIILRFGRRKLVELGGVRIGIVHGHEGSGSTTPERALRAFRNEQPELIVFGHSHIPHREQVGATMLFNPGSPTDKRRQPQFSYGIVTIRDQKIEAEHIFWS